MFRNGDFYHYEPGWVHRGHGGPWWYEDMPGVWLFSGKKLPKLSHSQYNLFGLFYFDGRIAYGDIEVMEEMHGYLRKVRMLDLPEEHIYRCLAYATEYASMNQSYRDYGKRPIHLPEIFGTLAGDLHRSTFIYRWATSLVGWERDFVKGYSKDVPLPSIVYSHRVFRQTCFHYGIDLDYRD